MSQAMSNCEHWADFVYRDFYDVPRAIVVAGANGARSLLLWCPFDDELDDYSDMFDVYWMNEAPSLDGSWEQLPSTATEHLGTVPVSQVRFDRTLRSRLDLISLGEVSGAARERLL